jgi:phosphonate transport system substrate-binding protein
VKPLRLLSYLAPSIPEELFALLAQTIESRAGVPVTLEFETRVSGPAPDSDPFAANRADLAFVCAPSYPLLKNAGSPVALLPVALVFADPRAAGRPVYFSDVVVNVGHPALRFEELRGSIWSYNDRYSRSGWQNMLAKLLEIGHAGAPDAFFRRLVQAGSHVRSLELVAAGQADAAAIDSNTLRLARRRNLPGIGGLRVLETWGPMPIQPLLVRAGLSASLRDRIAGILLRLHEEEGLRDALEAFGVQRFAEVDEAEYATVRPLGLPGPRPVTASR